MSAVGQLNLRLFKLSVSTAEAVMCQIELIGLVSRWCFLSSDISGSTVDLKLKLCMQIDYTLSKC